MDTRRLSAVLILIGVFAGVSAPASEPGRPALGIEWDSLHYEEPGIMTEDGSLYGVCGSYETESGQRVTRIAGSIAHGTVVYDGAYVDEETDETFPLRIDTPNTLLNLDGTLGWRAGDRGVLEVTPFAGLGGRLLVDDLPTEYGYLREQYYLYIPVGIDAAVSGDVWACGARLGYNILVLGYNRSSAAGWELNMTQESGYGFEASGRVSRAVKSAQGPWISLEPFWRYWHVDDSNVTEDGWFEPENTCAVYGLRGLCAF